MNFSPIPIDSTPVEYIISLEAVECSLRALNKCKSTCSLLWKCADVVPLGKIPKPKSVDSDLRLISHTTVLSKLLEEFVFKWLCPYIIPHIDPRQFDGIKNSSTTHALVNLIHQWIQATEVPGTMVRSCLIDFSKAFDRIDHNILMNKLRLLNVPPILLNWCANFLHGRHQRVKLGQLKSSWKSIIAGVPQGTKLGPHFFLVMINDLTTNLPLYKYIDDCSIFETVSPSSTSSLQNGVNQINQRTLANNVRINATKTKVLTVNFSKSPDTMDPLVNDQPVDSVESFKLLGIHIKSDLKWDLHVETICAKANKRPYAMRLLRRSGASPEDLRTIYYCFVQPILEYVCPVWHPSLTVSLCNELEQIQRRATRIILPDLCYNDRLFKLCHVTARERREDLCRRFFKFILRSEINIHDILPPPTEHSYSLRHPRTLPQNVELNVFRTVLSLSRLGCGRHRTHF